MAGHWHIPADAYVPEPASCDSPTGAIAPVTPADELRRAVTRANDAADLRLWGDDPSIALKVSNLLDDISDAMFHDDAYIVNQTSRRLLPAAAVFSGSLRIERAEWTSALDLARAINGGA